MTVRSLSVASNPAIIIDMTTNKDYRFNVSRELFRFLHEDTSVASDRTTKFDAFVHLLELATLQPKRVTAFGSEFQLVKGQFVTSYSELAEEWNWHRSVVRQFLCTLQEMHALSMDRRGKATLITMPISTAEDARPVRLLTAEEIDWLRFLFGMMSFEEFSELFDIAITGVEESVDALAKQDSSDKEIGHRLQRMIDHLVLHSSDLFPKSEEVADAFRSLFIGECHADLAQFFTVLTLGGLKIMDDLNDEPDIPFSVSEQASRQLDVILRYYTPLMGRTPSHSKAAPSSSSKQAPPVPNGSGLPQAET